MLLIILEDVVPRGHHFDTGAFKFGTIIMIEKKLADMCPNSNLKANPHIESKLKIGKKKRYSIVYDMLNKSGFGWNDSKKCVEVDSDEAWIADVQVQFLIIMLIYFFLRLFFFHIIMFFHYIYIYIYINRSVK